MTTPLTAWGERWDKKTKTHLAFSPTDKSLSPGHISFDQIPALDIMLGGGIPRGRTTVLVGAESSGKTLLAQLCIASAQRQGGIAMFFDVERTYDERWFALTGVDVDPEKLIIVRPDDLEQTYDMVCDALKTIQPDVIVVDSIAMMVPAGMMKKEMSDGDFRGLTARKTTEGVKKATQMNRSTALIFINQIRINMGQTIGNPETMPGGKGLRHASSLTIRMRQGARLNSLLNDFGTETVVSDEEVRKNKRARQVGFVMKLRTEKSKCAPPFQKLELDFFFDGHVDPIGPLLDLAMQNRVITGNGGFYDVPGIEKKIHGLNTLKETVRQNDELCAKLVELIEEALS